MQRSIIIINKHLKGIILNKVNKLANNVGRRLILPWNMGTRKGSRGPKTLFKYIAFYWAAWWASIASIFGFIV